MLRCSRRPHLSDVFYPHFMPLPTITPPKSTWRRAILPTKIQHRYHPRNSTKRSGQITMLLPKNLNVSGILGGFPDPKPPFGNIDPKKWVLWKMNLRLQLWPVEKGCIYSLNLPVGPLDAWMSQEVSKWLVNGL